MYLKDNFSFFVNFLEKKYFYINFLKFFFIKWFSDSDKVSDLEREYRVSNIFKDFIFDRDDFIFDKSVSIDIKVLLLFIIHLDFNVRNLKKFEYREIVNLIFGKYNKYIRVDKSGIFYSIKVVSVKIVKVNFIESE